MKHKNLTMGTFIRVSQKTKSLFNDDNLYNLYNSNNKSLDENYKLFKDFLMSKKLLTSKEFSKMKICNLYETDFIYDNVMLYKNSCFIDVDLKTKEFNLTLYNSYKHSENLLELELILFFEYYKSEIID